MNSFRLFYHEFVKLNWTNHIAADACEGAVNNANYWNFASIPLLQCFYRLNGDWNPSSLNEFAGVVGNVHLVDVGGNEFLH